MLLEYRDFVIRFLPGEGQDQALRTVITSAVGEARGFFTPPFSAEELAGLSVELARSAGDAQARHLHTASRQGSQLDLETAGERLFEALFTDEMRTLLDRAREDGSALRIVVSVDPGHPQARVLHDLPWELLRRPAVRSEETTTRSYGNYLARNRFTPVVRYTDVDVRPGSETRSRPLRILLVVSEPGNLQPLELDREARAIADTWAEHLGVEVATLESPATWEHLQRKMLGGRFNVLHFMGHGAFDQARKEGVLLLEDDDRRSAPVAAEDLADLAMNAGTLRLAVLNACHSAEAPGSSVFSGVATALVGAGVPSVVAMQAPIGDRAAISFSASLYQRLAAGSSLEEAVSLARLGFKAATPDWAKPVLFQRTASGPFFDEQQEPNMFVSISLNADAAERGRELWAGRFTAAQIKHWHIDLLEQGEKRRASPEQLHQARDLADQRIREAGIADYNGPVELLMRVQLPLACWLGWRLRNLRRLSAINDFAGDLTRFPAPKAPVRYRPGADLELLEQEIIPGPAGSKRAMLLIDLIGKSTMEQTGGFFASPDDDTAIEGTRVRLALKPDDPPDLTPDTLLPVLQDMVQCIGMLRKDRGANEIHLGMACPDVFAFCLGRELNALGKLHLHEYYDDEDGGRYLRALSIP